MRIYSSENKHEFTDLLFKEINAFGIGNITMDIDRNFTAIIEAVEYEDYEEIDIGSIFSKDELNARLLLADKISIPFYIITYQREIFSIYECEKNNDVIVFELKHNFKELEFLNWWSIIKGTKQTHKLNNGAQFRVGDTIFHKVLKKYDLKWGGNIDGILIKNNEIIAVIDNISIAFVPINHPKADPALFFFKRGPRYETWLSTVKLSMMLNVPHLLFTLDKNNPRNEIIGLTAIDQLSRRGVFYVNNEKPSNNIKTGLKNIKESIFIKTLESNPPRLE